MTLPLFKIARLIVWWRYGGASVYIEIDLIFIFLQKIFNSLNSIAENLLIGLTIGKVMCICEIYSLKLVFIWDIFMGKYNESPKNLLELCPKPHQGCSLDQLGGSQHPQNPQLVIAIAVQSFSQNSKENWPANFSLFLPLHGKVYYAQNKLNGAFLSSARAGIEVIRYF